MSSVVGIHLHRAAPPPAHFTADQGRLPCQDLAAGSILGGKLESFRGRSVLLAMREQLATALALLELDGVARRLVLCTPDLTPEQLAGVTRHGRSRHACSSSVAARPAPESLAPPSHRDHGVDPADLRHHGGAETGGAQL